MKHFYVRAKDENCPAISFAELDRIRKELDTSKTDELHAQAILAAMKLDIHHKPGKNRTALQRAKAQAKEMKRDADIVERSSRRLQPRSKNPFVAPNPPLAIPKAQALPRVVKKT